MNILGISCYYHDSAACLLQDGRIVSAAQEERFNRRKNSSDFPLMAANYCLQAGNVTINDIDYIGFYEKPFLKFSRVVLSHLRSYPFSLPNFLSTMPHWLQDRLIMPMIFKRELGYEGKSIFIKHHLSHAASAFLVSPFEEAAILTADSVGEWATTTMGSGCNSEIKILNEIHFPDSLGLLYTAITTYLGFAADEGEGKVMGLAAYGKPRYIEALRNIVVVRADGSFIIDQRFFGFNTGFRMYSRKFVAMFGPARVPDGLLEERHCDMAASLQLFIEETLISIARNLYRITKSDNLCLAGGVFLNCVANSRIIEETPFKNIFIQPAAGDSGGAIGVASYMYHSLLGNQRDSIMNDTYLGPDYSANQVRRALASAGLDFREMEDGALSEYVAERIAQNKIVGWFQGRMEFGPRALGNRSILANPMTLGMKDYLNNQVKHRESFRPFAPVVLEEKANEYFHGEGSSPFMLLSPKVKENKKHIIPAVTHIDGTARLQTVRQQSNEQLWRLIVAFETLTGVPVLLNTSFNLRGEPIVCTPQDAIDVFQRTKMDCLVMGNIVVDKI
ncbi:MAG: carbamoyltransferase [Elusimicrobia bacterium]|nr:carbamoyltransferase [Elusimicrobiota bacterium]